MSGPLSLPDDTIEFDVDQPTDRPLGLMIGIGVLTLLVLVGLGYLVFGNLTGGDGGSSVGLGGPGAPPPIGDSPSPDPSGTAPVPISATTPATTPTHSATPSASASTVAVNLAIVNGAMKPQSYTGPDCPASTMAQATVVANGPVTIIYHWNYTIAGKQKSLPDTAYPFPAAGSKTFPYQPPALTTPSARVIVTFVVTTPVTRRASMMFTQECGAKASDIVAPAHPRCGVPMMLSSTMSAGVAPMTIGYRWQVPGVITPPHVQTWNVLAGGDQKDTTQTVTVLKGQDLKVTLILDRLSPPTPAPGSLTFKTSITLTCT